MSVKFRFSCGMTLLACQRYYWQLVSAAQESIDETAKAKQVIWRADQ